MPNSALRLDKCGECAGNDSCLDCAGVVNGSHRIDSCGRCLQPFFTCTEGPRKGKACGTHLDCHASLCETVLSGFATDETAGGNAPAVWNACVDCAGVVNGSARLDSCGECNGHNEFCLPGYAVELVLPGYTHRGSRVHVCVGDELRAQWQVALPLNQRDIAVGLEQVRGGETSGTDRPVLAGWAYLDPTSACNRSADPGDYADEGSLWGVDIVASLQTSSEDGVVIGQSSWVQGRGRGLVVMNSSSDAQGLTVTCAVGEDGAERLGQFESVQTRILNWLEYQRPLTPGGYRLRLSASGNLHPFAQSRVFQVRV